MNVRLGGMGSWLARLLVIGLTALSAALLFLGIFAAAYISGLVIEQRSLLRIILIILVFAIPLSAIPFLYRLFDRWIPGLPPFVAMQRSAGASAQARDLNRALTNVHSANQRERVAAVVALARSASPAAVEPLIGALVDEDAEVRLNASAGLSALGTKLRDEAAAARARSALQEYRERGGA
jgi:HEAT repeat protein